VSLLTVALLAAGCGYGSLPASSYGHGPWSFRVHFLSVPDHDGVTVGGAQETLGVTASDYWK
jgi:hypothetical protein